MSVPEWFLDLAQKHLRLGATRVGLALFRAGHRGVDPATGDPIIRCQLSLAELVKLTHLSRNGVLTGLKDLQDLAGLVRHQAVAPSAPWGYSLPLEKRGVQKLHPGANGTAGNGHPVTSGARYAGGAVSVPPYGGGGGEIPSNNDLNPPPPPPGVVKGVQKVHPPRHPSMAGGTPPQHPGDDSAGGTPPPPPVDQAQLLADLVELGVTDPQDFLGKFALERVSAWVKWVLAQPKGRHRNPAGLIFRKLQEGKDPPALPGAGLDQGADPRQFTKGKYGHVYKY